MSLLARGGGCRGHVQGILWPGRSLQEPLPCKSPLAFESSSGNDRGSVCCFALTTSKVGRRVQRNGQPTCNVVRLPMEEPRALPGTCSKAEVDVSTTLHASSHRRMTVGSHRCAPKVTPFWHRGRRHGACSTATLGQRSKIFMRSWRWTGDHDTALTISEK